MHTIRLREPWKVEFESGRVVYRRYFNCPTGLTPRDAVSLAIDQLDVAARVSLNTQPLAGGVSSTWEITPWLQPRNVVQVSIASETPPEQRPFGEVRLEIS